MFIMVRPSGNNVSQREGSEKGASVLLSALLSVYGKVKHSNTNISDGGLTVLSFDGGRPLPE